MSRDGGFATADLDVLFLDDPKVRRLVREVRDEAAVARCAIAYVALVTASWRAGCRVTIEEAVPIWLTDVDSLATHLTTVGLIDADGRIPEHAWESWFNPAHERREVLRERWRRSAKGRRAKSGEASSASESARTTRGHREESATSVPIRTVSPVPTGPSLSRPRGRLEPVGSIAPRVVSIAERRGGPTT